MLDEKDFLGWEFNGVVGIAVKPSPNPFPYDRYEGKGFLREEEVDLERVNTYYDGAK